MEDEVFDTEVGRVFYGWCVGLDMDSFRNQAHTSEAISIRQKTDLMDIRGNGREVHNAKLLGMVAEAKTVEKYRKLAATVKALGHKERCTQLMDLLSALGHPAEQSQAAEARRQDPIPPVQPEFVEDLFAKPEYKVLRLKLVQAMDMDTARLFAEAYSLITRTQMDKLSTAFEYKGRDVHNRELLRMIEVGGPQALRTFSDKVLADLEMPDYQAKLNRIGRGL